MNRLRRVLMSLGAAVLAAATSGVVLAADSRLDLADDHIEKAIALVAAAQNANARDASRPFGGHDTKAIRLMEAARDEIAKAKAYADDPRNWVSAEGEAVTELETAPGPPNLGLVEALDAVGSGLWGAGGFGSSLIAIHDESGNLLPAVQIDLQDTARLPAIFTVFTTPGPPNEPVCRAYLQIQVGPGGVVLRFDPEAAPADFQLVGEFDPLVGVPPNPCAVERNP